MTISRRPMLTAGLGGDVGDALAQDALDALAVTDLAEVAAHRRDRALARDVDATA